MSSSSSETQMHIESATHVMQAHAHRAPINDASRRGRCYVCGVSLENAQDLDAPNIAVCSRFCHVIFRSLFKQSPSPLILGSTGNQSQRSFDFQDSDWRMTYDFILDFFKARLVDHVMFMNIKKIQSMQIWQSIKEGLFTSKKSGGKVDPSLRPLEIMNIKIESRKVYSIFQEVYVDMRREYQNYIESMGMPSIYPDQTITLYRNVTVDNLEAVQWDEILPFSTSRRLSFAQGWNNNPNAILLELELPIYFQMLINDFEDPQAEVLIAPSRLTIVHKNANVWRVNIIPFSEDEIMRSIDESLEASLRLTEEQRDDNANRLKAERQRNRDEGGDDWD